MIAKIVLLVVFILVAIVISLAAVSDFIRLFREDDRECDCDGQCELCQEDIERRMNTEIGDLIYCQTECEMITAIQVCKDYGILVRRADPDDGKYNLIVIGYARQGGNR